MDIRKRFSRNRCAGLVGIGLLAWTSSARALVNLELRPMNPSVGVGAPIDLGLYAVSSTMTPEIVNGMNVVLTWDPTKLQLLGNDRTGEAFGIFFSYFPPGGLNEVVPPADGEGLYIMFATPGIPPSATPAGILITTFQFTTLAPSAGTPVQIPAMASDSTQTVVYTGPVPNQPGTGSLSGATVEITGGGGGGPGLPVPTVSEWGLIILMLLLLTAATLVFGRRTREDSATRPEAK